MHVARSAIGMHVLRERHPGGRPDPARGDRMDARVLGHDRDAAHAVC